MHVDLVNYTAACDMVVDIVSNKESATYSILFVNGLCAIKGAAASSLGLGLNTHHIELGLRSGLIRLFKVKPSALSNIHSFKVKY